MIFQNFFNALTENSDELLITSDNNCAFILDSNFSTAEDYETSWEEFLEGILLYPNPSKWYSELDSLTAKAESILFEYNESNNIQKKTLLIERYNEICIKIKKNKKKNR